MISRSSQAGMFQQFIFADPPDDTPDSSRDEHGILSIRIQRTRGTESGVDHERNQGRNFKTKSGIEFA